MQCDGARDKMGWPEAILGAVNMNVNACCFEVRMFWGDDLLIGLFCIRNGQSYVPQKLAQKQIQEGKDVYAHLVDGVGGRKATKRAKTTGDVPGA